MVTMEHRRGQDFCSVVHTLEAVAGSWESVSDPVVGIVMCGAPERNENSNKIYMKLYLGEGFCKIICCQPQIHKCR